MLFNAINVYLFIGIITTSFFTAFVYSRSKADYVKLAMLLCLCINVFMFGYIMELRSVTLEHKLFWNYFQYIGIPFVSALWFSIASVYISGYRIPLYIRILFIFMIPAITFVLRMTNNLHHLYYLSEKLQTSGDNVFLVKEKGSWLFVQGFHSLLLIVSTFVLYVNALVKQKNRERENMLFMLGASVLAVSGLVLNILSIGTANIDYMVILLPAAIIMVILAIMRNDFWEAKALARDIIFENNDEGIILLNNRGRIFDFNTIAKSILSNRGIQLRKEPLEVVFGGVNDLSDLISSSQARIWMIKVESGYKYYCLTSINIRNQVGSVSGKLITIRDITQMQLLHNQLKIQATTDELSGLLNRRAFTDLCQARLNDRRLNKENAFLLMIDIDLFKSINDTYGHLVGDHVIEKLGEIFRQNFRTTDLIGRLGGEEFTVFMQTESCDAALSKAEQFRKAVEQSEIVVEGNILHISISIGLVCTDSGTGDILDLMNKADKALYASKNGGRNRTTIYKSAIDPADVGHGQRIE